MSLVAPTTPPMTLARFLVGFLLAAAVTVPIALGSRAVRRRTLPSWSGLEAGLADVVLGVSTTVVVCEALGSIGLFRTVPVVIGLGTVGLGVWRVAETWAKPAPLTEAPPAVMAGASGDRSLTSTCPPTAHVVIAGFAIAAVVGGWLARVAQALSQGMETVDTLWYHLPVAARFVQTGRVTGIHYLDADPVTAFFPATSSLLHGLGILLFGTDLASTMLNLGWLALALVAGWCIGKPFGVQPLTAVGVALLMGTPGMVATQPGGGYTDTMGLALLLVAVALLVYRPEGARSGAQDLIIALAAGLSLGTKFTFVGPVAILALALILTAPRRRRLRRAGLVAAGLVVSGGFWYVRNLLVVGNPLPSLALHLGPLEIPSLKGSLPTASVSQFVLNSSSWRDFFLPGLRSALGPAWPAIAAAVLVGAAVGIFGRRPSAVRVLAFLTAASLVLFTLTPQYLTVLGVPFFFVYNLRYATPALVLGLVTLPLVLRRWRNWVLGGYTIAFVATQLDPTSWPTGFGWAVFQDRITWADAAWGLAAAIAVAAVWMVAVCSPAHRARLLSGGRLAAGSTVAASLVLTLVHGHYLEGRYADTPLIPTTYAWARDLNSSRIAVVGLYMQEQYPFYGADLSNWVQFAGITTESGGFRPIESCAEWSAFLHSGRYDYVVIAPPSTTSTPPPQIAWTESQPGAELVHSETVQVRSALITGPLPVHVFRLDPSGPLSPC